MTEHHSCTGCSACYKAGGHPQVRRLEKELRELKAKSCPACGVSPANAEIYAKRIKEQTESYRHHATARCSECLEPVVEDRIANTTHIHHAESCSRYTKPKPPQIIGISGNKA